MLTTLKLVKELSCLLDFGITLTQFSIDRDRLITEIPGDVAVMNSNNQLITDCNFGNSLEGGKSFCWFLNF